MSSFTLIVVGVAVVILLMCAACKISYNIGYDVGEAETLSALLAESQRVMERIEDERLRNPRRN